MRKMMSFLLALCLIVAIVPVGAGAAATGQGTSSSPYVVTTADELKDKLDDATAGSPVYIKLNAANFEGDFTVTGNVSLNLNGKKITNRSGHTITVKKNASLTITGSGTVDNVTHGKAPIWNEGTVTLNGGSYIRSEEAGASADDSGDNSYYALVNHGTMTINSGVSVIQNGHFSSLLENGYFSYNSNDASSGYVEKINAANPTLTINGGTFTGGLNTVKNDDGGVVTINGGTFSNTSQAAVLNWNKATINGGSFTVDVAGQNCIINGAYSSSSSAQDLGDLTITGGNFTSEGEAACIFNYFTDVKPVITGGTFSSNVSDYCAEGYQTATIGGKTVVVTDTADPVATVGEYGFNTLNNAFAVAQGNDTIVLRQNTEVNLSVIISDGRQLTLDMNGYDAGFAYLKNISIYHGSLNITGSGKLYETEPYYAPVILYGSKDDVADYTTVTVGENVTLEGWAGLFVDQLEANNNGANAFGIVAKVYGTLHSVKDISGGGGHAFYLQGTIKATSGHVPKIILDGATLNTDEGNGMYLAGYADTTVTNSTVTSNGENSTGMEIRAGKLEITNSTVIGGDEEYKFDANGNGSTTNNAALAVAQHTTKLPIDVKVNSGNFFASAAFVQINPQGNDNVALKKITLDIAGGNFDGLFQSVNKTAFVSGGYFTSDPSEYVVAGKAVLPSDQAGYAFMVGDKPTVTDVTPATGAPAVDMSSIPLESQSDVKAAASSVEDNGELAAAAYQVLEKVTEYQKKAAEEAINASDSGVTVGQNEVKVYVQTYLDITPTEYQKDGTTSTLTMDITPMYRVVASTATEAKDIKVVGEVNSDANAVVLENSERKLTSIQTMTISIQLPTGFVSNINTPVYIQHKGYEYSATADSNGKITFTNPHGFSTFTFSTTSKAVAKIDGTTYTSLQEAINHVENGQTIILLKDDSATVSREVSFTIANESGQATLTPGSGYTMTEGKDGQYTFTKKSSTPVTPGPSEDNGDADGFPFTDVKSSDWYYNAVKYVYENGLMAGTSDTTFDPETKLTRAMAAQILYNLDGQPTVSGDATFTDMNVAPAWSFTAVAWAQDTGVVAGMGDGTFAPNDNVTREQFAQMMYNYAKYKEYDMTKTGDLSKFPDNESVSGWAETALSWANGNGLINGHDDGTLAPQGNTIRGQAASILMNFDLNLVK